MNDKIIDNDFFQNLDQLSIYIKDNLAGSFGGSHRSKSYGSSCEFADYREYIPGDDIRRIDWNVFSRYEKLFLKLFLDERQMHIKIYLDCSKSMQYGKNKKSLLALKLAIAFTYLSIIAMDKVSVYAIHDKKCEKIINGIVGKESFYNSVNLLEKVEFYGDSYLTEAIMPSDTISYSDGMSIIISDFLTDHDYETVLGVIENKKRDVTCVQILSDEEINPRILGKQIFYDSENSKRLYRKNISKDDLKAYQMALDYLKNRVEHYCVTRGINYIFTSSSTPISDIILNTAVKKEIVR